MTGPRDLSLQTTPNSVIKQSKVDKTEGPALEAKRFKDELRKIDPPIAKITTADKANPGNKDNTRRLQPVPGKWERYRDGCLRQNNHNASGIALQVLEPQGHPNYPQEQRH